MGVATNSQLERLHAPGKGGGLRVLRIVNRTDMVPQTPPPIGFTHVGQVFNVDSTRSPFMMSPTSVAGPHDMEAYLHAIAGMQGKQGGGIAGTSSVRSNGGFDLAGRRDFSLVNKYLDALKPEYLIPDKWWCSEYKGMVQQSDGTYKLQEGNWIMDKEHQTDDEQD
ncbi:Phospholipase a1 [Thalictrum thalictroides]|uniref:Phospholipase A1 n=1 Tax=Thalictrum thalictroides TaxID=46969 RepID=A0A7J6VB14_THATH|nr:Phospholipase a1 [Thalictrum thalictroides]